MVMINEEVIVTPELIAAVEKGIVAREKKCVDRRKKSNGLLDGEGMVWLKASAERIRLLLRFAESRQSRMEKKPG